MKEQPLTQHKVRVKLLAHQADLVFSPKEDVFLVGGVGSGKTEVGSIWTLNQVNQSPEGVIGIIAANSYTQLIDSTLRNFYKNMQKWGVIFKPIDLPKSHNPFNLFIWNGKHWVEILCRSLDSYKLLAGVEVGWIWIDEVFLSKKEAMDVVVARARDDRCFNQIAYTTTADEPSHWLYERVVENLDPNDDLIYATTFDNPFLKPSYIRRLERQYSPQMFQRMCMAKWVSLEGVSLYGGNFDRKKHVWEGIRFDPFKPLLWTHDFNIGQDKPMSSAIAQMVKGKDPKGKDRWELHFIDEIVIDTADTHEACQEFQDRGWGKQAKNIIVYGDATGKAKDSRSKTTDYKIIFDFLRSHNYNFATKVPSKNPPIRERHNAVNALLVNQIGDIRMRIHPRCKTLIKGMETTKVKKGSTYIEEETREQHITTAGGYLINKEFPIVKFLSSKQKHWK